MKSLDLIIYCLSLLLVFLDCINSSQKILFTCLNSFSVQAFFMHFMFMPQPYQTGTEKRDGGNSFSLKTFGLVKKLV